MVKHICPPYLHILLGIVKKQHDLLEAATHKIDLQIANDIAEQSTELGEGVFDKFVKGRRVILEQRQKLIHLKQQLNDLENNDSIPLNPLMKRVKHLTHNIEQIEKKVAEKEKSTKLDILSGPVTANLDAVLQANGIRVQAYHSRSFIGNHCNKYLQEDVYTALCDGIVTKAKKLSKNPLTINKAYSLAAEYRELCRRFAQVHTLVSHGRPVNPADVTGIQKRIDAYMGYFRRHFPEQSVTPKMHMLEDHIVPWIEKWGVGMALHGEQGGEGIHKEFNRLHRVMAGIKDPLQQLLATMREHHVSCDPNIQKEIPEIKRRKLSSRN